VRVGRGCGVRRHGDNGGARARQFECIFMHCHTWRVCERRPGGSCFLPATTQSISQSVTFLVREPTTASTPVNVPHQTNSAHSHKHGIRARVDDARDLVPPQRIPHSAHTTPHPHWRSARRTAVIVFRSRRSTHHMIRNTTTNGGPGTPRTRWLVSAGGLLGGSKRGSTLPRGFATGRLVTNHRRDTRLAQRVDRRKGAPATARTLCRGTRQPDATAITGDETVRIAMVRSVVWAATQLRHANRCYQMTSVFCLMETNITFVSMALSDAQRL